MNKAVRHGNCNYEKRSIGTRLDIVRGAPVPVLTGELVPVMTG